MIWMWAGLTFRKTRGLLGRKTTYRAHTRPHMLWIPAQRQQFERYLGQTYLLIMESPRRAGGSWVSLATERPEEATLKILFYHADTKAGKGHFGILPPDNDSLVHQWVYSSMWHWARQSAGGAYPTHPQSQVTGHCHPPPQKPAPPTSTTTETTEGRELQQARSGASLTYCGHQ